MLEVARHARGEGNRLTSSNVNDLARLVALELPIDAKTVIETWPRGPADETGGKPDSRALAIQPMNLIDVVEKSMLELFPVSEQDEAAAVARAQFLTRMKESVRRTLDIPLTGPEGDQFQELYRQIVEVEASSFGAQRRDGHRQRLDPLLDQARAYLCGLRGPDGCLFTPPAMFVWIANDQWPSRGVDLTYVGHGFHLSLVHRTTLAEPEP
jgi:hypothetical protein